MAKVWEWLEAVPDPEIPVISVVDLGIVRDVAWADDTLEVTVTPTYSGCPATSVIAHDIDAALGAKGVGDVRIKTQIAPAWTTDWLSEKGRTALQGLWDRAAASFRWAEVLPAVSLWGCGAGVSVRVNSVQGIVRCNDCLEPFDYFKCI